MLYPQARYADRFFRAFLVAATIALLAPTSAQAAGKKTIDFSSFRGTYNGTYLISDGNDNYTGGVTITAKALQHGQKLVVKINGQAAGPGITYPVAGSFTMNRKRISSDNVMMGLGGVPIATLSGKFTGKKKNFGFTFTAAPGAQFSGSPISGAVNYSLIFGRKSLLIVGSGTLTTSSTFPATLQITTTKSGK